MGKVHFLTIIFACGTFAGFLANVMIGAEGGEVFLSDVGEMLTLFAACIGFVIIVLHQEQLKASHAVQIENDSKKEDD
jgi:hypothetical protein